MITPIEKLLLKAIYEFDKKANELIKLFAKKYNLDLNEENPFDKLMTRSEKLWQGSLCEDWTYHFHGDSCKIENLNSSQLLDIKINRQGNYGAIDNFYLRKFIETTKTLGDVHDLINSSKTMHEVLESLENKGLIKTILEMPKTRILDKAKAKPFIDN